MKQFPPLLSPARLLPLLCFVFFVSFVVPSYGGDWVHWRGPEQNGVSREKDLPEKFDPATGENVIWKVPYGGRTTPLVMGGRVFGIQGYNATGKKITEQERVFCLDDKDGKLLWEYRFNVFFTDIVSDRLGWSNLGGDPETGNVYAHGTGGLLLALNRDGKLLWQRSLTEEYGRISGYGGRLVSPIVDGDLVIVGVINASWGDQARGGNRFVAFDKKSGDVVWWASTGLPVKDTYFSTPVVAVINGKRLLITGGGDGGVHAFEVRTGKKVWSHVLASAAVNLSPVVDGTKVYVGHGEINANPESGELGRLICLDAGEVSNGKPKVVWQVDGIIAKFATPILHEGRLYVADLNARLHCLDAATGKKLWRIGYGRNSMGSPVLGDGKIYVNPVQTDFVILKPGATKGEKVFTYSFAPTEGSSVDVELNGSPAVANGRVYFQTSNEFYCIGKKDHQAKADAIPEAGKEAEGGKAASVTVFPADVVLNPGESKQLTVRVLDAQGRVLRETAKGVTWKLAPPSVPPPLPNAPPPPTPPMPPPTLQGEISEEGKLTAAKAPPGQFGTVEATLDGLTGSARVRVAPVLPFAADFSKVPVDRSPGGWVNTQGKFAVQDKGGQKVLVKLATNPSPLVARANAFLGKPDLKGYTIQADLLGKQAGSDLPDMGIVNCRYTFMFDGNKQQLRLYSWDALPRIDRTITREWKPDAWYTFKLMVDVQGDKALVKGKVWERGQEEPKAWTVEVEDPLPNREGSPGLYGNATGISETAPGAEIYYDKVSVTPNPK